MTRHSTRGLFLTKRLERVGPIGLAINTYVPIVTVDQSAHRPYYRFDATIDRTIAADSSGGRFITSVKKARNAEHKRFGS
jgi:hypothetical protein